MLKLKKFARLSFSRLSSTLSSNQVLEHLPNRTLIRICGIDSPNFLQGLITNDIEHLSSGPGSMYSMLLNTAGRVLYDVIIYRNLEKDTFLIECDSRVSDKLQKHLKLYRVRRKVDITNIGDEFKVYALFNNNQKKVIDSDKVQFSDGNIVPCQELIKPQQTTSFKTHQNLLIYRDPRIIDLGSRILARTDTKPEEALNDVIKIETINPSERSYRWIRYNLGVGEGIEDLPPGECFPLESNCDYLHGVSFHKGCYIGQELTARVHHTGVVRKRLMPIYFTKIPSKSPDEKIVQEKVNLGKLRGIEKDVGLAALRIDKALAFKEIQIGDGIALTSKPHWWPVEAPKEKINIAKV